MSKQGIILIKPIAPPLSSLVAESAVEFYEIKFLSNVRYWIGVWMFSAPSRSAMVRANFRIRV